jgi:hypothetical protein
MATFLPITAQSPMIRVSARGLEAQKRKLTSNHGSMELGHRRRAVGLHLEQQSHRVFAAPIAAGKSTARWISKHTLGAWFI